MGTEQSWASLIFRRWATSATVRPGLFFGGAQPRSQLKNPIDVLSRTYGRCELSKKAGTSRNSCPRHLAQTATSVTCYGGSLLDPADETSARALHLSTTKAAR